MSLLSTQTAQETPKAVEENSNPTSNVEVNTEVKAEGSNQENQTEEKTTEVKSVVPEKYELKLPEGSTLSAAQIEKVTAYAKEHKLSNDQAQALLESKVEAVSDYSQTLREQFNQQTEAWVEELKADKDIGGESFNQNIEIAKRAISHFGDESFRNDLDRTGLGSHPGLVKFMVNVGKAMSEDKLVIPGSQSGSRERSVEEIFYGENK